MAVALIAAGVVLLDSQPAQAQTTVDRKIWSATLTVKQIDANSNGCNNLLSAGKKCSESAVLSDDVVTYDGTTYTITSIYRETSILGLFFASSTPFVSEGLTFHVDGTRYPFTSGIDASTTQFQFRLPPSWTIGQEVSLKITEALDVPAPREPPPPDPGDPPETEPRKCACTQVAAVHFPERCSRCAIIRSCSTP